MNSAATLPSSPTDTEQTDTTAPCCPVCATTPTYLRARNTCPTTLPRRY